MTLRPGVSTTVYAATMVGLYRLDGERWTRLSADLTAEMGSFPDALAFDAETAGARVCPAGGGEGWEVTAGAQRAAVAAPRARMSAGAARALGADTAAVFADLDIRC